MNESDSDAAARAFQSRFRVRSYELDGFGHLNHAVYLNYFEQARFDALAAGGFSLERLAERGWGVHVVRVEVDFRREALLGQEMLVRTRVAEARSSSMTLEQVAIDPARSDRLVEEGRVVAGRPDAVFAEGRIVAVWIGPDRAPMRIPQEVRKALGVGQNPPGAAPR
jgi:YbgC/YbaW family acyl-CoA thioester hydrolase